MSEQQGHEAGAAERETASLTGSGEIRKGIEIVTVQDMPVPPDYQPPAMGLGGQGASAASDADTAEE